jgi:pimeloyl-ACP methyl ester carboxylesterase
MELRTITTNGIRMRVAEQGSGPLVLLLHGFPESWYSWRHQIHALAAAGFRVVAPDQRGYGGTEAPATVESYGIRHLVGDAVGVLDALGEGQAVVIGHDWGAPVAWHCALFHPERFPAVAALSVPYVGRSPLPPLEMFRTMAGENFFYILYFQAPGVAERELEADVRSTLRRFLYAASGDVIEPVDFWRKPKTAKFLDGLPDPKKLPSWLGEADLDYYTSEFRRTGFRGGLNWYRNIDSNWRDTPELAGAKIEQPALFVAGDRDGVLAMIPPDAMREVVPNLRRLLLLPGCGHWTQQERPAEVNAALIEFLGSLRG